MTNAVHIQRSFEAWRDAARKLIALDVPPDAIAWIDDDSSSLLPELDLPDAAPSAFQVPAEFVGFSRLVACFRDPQRWALLYRMLWRLTHGEKQLLQDATDDDTHRFFAMHRKVRLDRHKMTAFVRFRAVQSEDGSEPHYIAWHRPDHFILRLTAPFFQRRFASMKWTILTPDESVTWDGTDLRFSEGVPASQAPAGDELETLWRTYYANIFNPARLNLKMMRREMPVRHWATLPETEVIDDLIREAPRRVEEMVKKQTATKCKSTGSAADFLPPRISLPQLRDAIQGCRGCDLYCNATQAVFGEGPKDASIIFVGEQPGDQEDLAGKPFVGPSGHLLDEVMEEVGIPRDEVYVTNAVKHFKFEPRGTRRIHAKPNAREMAACKPWLASEISVIKPEIVVCLGSTAAQQLLGKQFRVTKSRGEWIKTDFAPRVMATVHPSSLLRMPDHDARVQARKMFTHDLNLVAKALRKMKASA